MSDGITLILLFLYLSLMQSFFKSLELLMLAGGVGLDTGSSVNVCE